MALGIQCTKAFIKVVVCRVTFKLTFIIDELFPELFDYRHSTLLLDQCHKVKWLSKIERRGNLEVGREREKEIESESEKERYGE